MTCICSVIIKKFSRCCFIKSAIDRIFTKGDYGVVESSSKFITEVRAVGPKHVGRGMGKSG